ncbi:MAG: DUF389 domain-containing protein [Caldilineaceae bacterium]
MRQAAVPSVDFFVLIVLSAVIASFGLMQNSAAVIIGAMLVAPLMSPDSGHGYGHGRGRVRHHHLGIEATLKGVAMAVFVGIVAVLISPIDGPTSEILARTEPNLLDLMVALASGAAAGYALSRKEVACGAARCGHCGRAGAAALRRRLQHRRGQLGRRGRRHVALRDQPGGHRPCGRGHIPAAGLPSASAGSG